MDRGCFCRALVGTVLTNTEIQYRKSQREAKLHPQLANQLRIINLQEQNKISLKFMERGKST